MYIIHSVRNDYSIYPLMQDKTINPEAFILLNYQEWQYNSIGTNPSFEEIVDYVNDKNIPLYIVNGSVSEKNLIDTNNNRYNNVYFNRFPQYIFWHTYKSLYDNKNYRKYFDKNYYEQPTGFERLFVCLNNKPHPHRCMQMDLLVKHNLLDYGAVSWNSWFLDEGRVLNESYNYKWQYWTPQILALDNMIEGNLGWGGQLPIEYNTSFIHLVTESTTQAVFHTEKVAFPLLLTKLFLVSGPKHYYKALVDWGFKLYDELFDYSFDDIDDDQTRFEMVAQNLTKFKTLSNAYMLHLHNTLLDKLLYNKQQFLKICTDINLMPKLLSDLFENNHVNAQDNEIGKLRNWYYEYKNFNNPPNNN